MLFLFLLLFCGFVCVISLIFFGFGFVYFFALFLFVCINAVFLGLLVGKYLVRRMGFFLLALALGCGWVR